MDPARPQFRVLPCGDRAVLLAPADPAQVLALLARIDAAGAPAVAELVPAAETVLVRAAAGFGTDELTRVLRSISSEESGAAAALSSDTRELTLHVVYDGPDLDEVGRLTGLGAGGVVASHTDRVWTVAFCGFAPGFGYLRSDGDPLAVARRDTPRTRVPSGSVGLAGPYTGVYPTPSPGGWQLIGRSGARLWDVARTPPALLVPGTRVRFRAVVR